MQRPSTVKAALLFTLAGLSVSFVISLFVSTPLTIVAIGLLSVPQVALFMSVLTIVVTALSYFVVFVLVLGRFPFGPYRLRLVHKGAGKVDVFD